MSEKKELAIKVFILIPYEIQNQFINLINTPELIIENLLIMQKNMDG